MYARIERIKYTHVLKEENWYYFEHVDVIRTSEAVSRDISAHLILCRGGCTYVDPAKRYRIRSYFRKYTAYQDSKF
jgi:hypothetical protein